MPSRERTALALALILAALSTVGQGIQFFTEEYSSYATGMVVVITLNALAGIVLTFEADEFPDSMDRQANEAKSRRFARSLEHVVLVVIIEFVLGEALVVIALATSAPGIKGDVSVIFVPLVVGVLMGGMFCLIGTLVGFLVAWPLVKLVQFAVGKRTEKPANPVGTGLAILFVTLTAFAILAVLGSNPPEIIGTPRGRALYDIAFLYTSYSGTPPEQAMAWIARALGLVLVLEGVWIHHRGVSRGKSVSAR